MRGQSGTVGERFVFRERSWRDGRGPVGTQPGRLLTARFTVRIRAPEPATTGRAVVTATTVTSFDIDRRTNNQNLADPPPIDGQDTFPNPAALGLPAPRRQRNRQKGWPSGSIITRTRSCGWKSASRAPWD